MSGGRMSPVRNFWRSLTSMRVALILLLLLAVAAIPGSVLPQRPVNPEAVTAYLASHKSYGPLYDRLYLFNVYSSPWFSAIYLLLFVSLVGCLVPRLRHHLRNVVGSPPPAPSRLDRLPQSTTRTSTSSPDETLAEYKSKLRKSRWRVVQRGDTLCAEKGYVKETGNLLFHFALLALLLGLALGSWFGWHGNRILVAGPDSGFCDTLSQYDDYGLGPRTSAADLPPFCVTLDDFTAKYLDDGQPVQYTANVSYVDGADTAKPRQWRLEVNNPLRLDGANVYLLGHGYSPILRYTDRYGVVHTGDAPFLPEDTALTSVGVVKFQDANIPPTGRPRDNTSQMAFSGVYLPTMPAQADGSLSTFPGERDPGLVLVAYEGNLGLDSGFPQSVYSLDQSQIATGALHEVGRTKALKPGESWQLPDGSSVQFVGTKQWITVSVRHDPGEKIVLVGAGALLVGLTVSLSGRRRRVWVRVHPDNHGGSLISLGGLPRSDYPGFADELARVADLIGPHDDARPPGAVAQVGRREVSSGGRR
jgi:cytochrome c biogenesis protein